MSDIHIDCLRLAGSNGHYLQSSPEYFMKRLLAAGSGSIYCLGKAFRRGELGQRHYPEFTLLEWYRMAWDEHRLMAEVFELLVEIGVADQSQGIQKTSYRELFQRVSGIEPHLGDLSALSGLASKLADRDFHDEGRATCLDLIFSLLVEPTLPEELIFVYDYPACQAALAETAMDNSGTLVARRFEVFCDGVELANAYFELTDADELRARFSADNKQRKTTGKPPIEPDENLLAAMDAGLPVCAGVALGLDRVLMNLLGAKQISEILAFADLR